MISDEIGVVVIGRNEGERLVRCLELLQSQTSTIVYVDSGSSDDSMAVARKFGAVVVALDAKIPFTAARARNEGFCTLKRVSPHIRLVQFVDGDCILVKSWLDAALSFIRENADVAVVCGRRRELYPNVSIYNRLADREWDTPVGEASACGGDALMRIDALKAVNGFRAELIAGEEPELCLRLRAMGWRIWRLDADMTWHDLAMTRFDQWWSRTVRSGYGMTEVWWLHRKSATSIWRRQTASAIIWGGLLPLAICLAALVYPLFIAAVLIYPLQIARIAFRQRTAISEPLAYGCLAVFGKFALFQGLLRYCWNRWRGRNLQLIEYK